MATSTPTKTTPSMEPELIPPISLLITTPILEVPEDTLAEDFFKALQTLDAALADL